MPRTPRDFNTHGVILDSPAQRLGKGRWKDRSRAGAAMEKSVLRVREPRGSARNRFVTDLDDASPAPEGQRGMKRASTGRKSVHAATRARTATIPPKHAGRRRPSRAERNGGDRSRPRPSPGSSPPPEPLPHTPSWARGGYVSHTRPAAAGTGARPLTATPATAMYRGGAFDQPAQEARSANRAGGPPTRRHFGLGVRVVRPVQP